MEYADSLIDRYDKVCRLAEGGVGGERSNAETQRSRMQDRYPGINYQSQLRARQTMEEEHPELGAYDPARDSFGGGGSRWQRWGNLAESAFSWAAHAAGEAVSADYAHRCAEQFVEIRGKNLASAKYQIAAKITLKDLYSCAEHLTPIQKQVFAQWVGDQVSQMVMSALEDEEE